MDRPKARLEYRRSGASRGNRGVSSGHIDHRIINGAESDQEIAVPIIKETKARHKSLYACSLTRVPQARKSGEIGQAAELCVSSQEGQA